MCAIFLKKAVATAIASSVLPNTPVNQVAVMKIQDTPPPAPETPAQKNPNAFNPQMAIIGDFRGTLRDTSDEERKFDFNEIELNFAADVDPFAKAFLVIAIANEDGETITEVEEGFLTYSNLAKGLSGKVGKIAAAIGRVQRNHSDQLEFLEYPFVIQDTLGDEGLRAGGASFSYLFPGDRFHELTVELLDPAEDGPLFMGSSLANPVWIGHYRTFFDFSEDLSAQLGATYAGGPNGEDGTANLYGADYTMKWSPGSKGKSAILEAEAYWSNPNSKGRATTFGGFASLSYQIMPRWFLTAKGDYSELPGTEDIRRGTSLGVTYRLSEFQHWRLEFQRITSNFEDSRNVLTLQFQWLIGKHPAHKY